MGIDLRQVFHVPSGDGDEIEDEKEGEDDGENTEGHHAGYRQCLHRFPLRRLLIVIGLPVLTIMRSSFSVNQLNSFICQFRNSPAQFPKRGLTTLLKIEPKL